MSLIPSLVSNRSILNPFCSDMWGPIGSNSEVSSFANARVDWKETPEAHVFEADLPGVKKEEVKVEVEEGRVLHISGERSVEKEEKNDKWHRVERDRGRFQRKFWLPENAKLDEVKASMEDGVLTVTVPKAPEKKPQVKTIEISTST
ncbi:17.6 kDa class I heat shock protein 3, partial [Mucuna pruriens]